MTRRTRYLPILSSVAALGLCGWAACVEDQSTPQRAHAAESVETASSESSGTPSSFEHEVRRGETLWEIARLYDIPMEDIMELNGFDRRGARSIDAGDIVRIPGVRPTPATQEAIEPPPAAAEDAPSELTAAEIDLGNQGEATSEVILEERPPIDTRNGAFHELTAGETLWDVSRLYDRPLDEIMERNHFTDDDVRSLQAGHRVFVPGARPAQVQRIASQRESHRRGVHHTLEEDQTIWDLARIYRVSVAEIMAANRLTPNQVNGLRTGRRLFVPGGDAPANGTNTSSRQRLSRRQLRALNYARRLGLGTRDAASQLLRGVVRPSWIRAAGAASRLPGTLRWPVTNGRFVRGFGSGEAGYHLATDIAGDIGWNVRAAAPGIVAYSGNELRGFGNIVMVVHPGGWVTLYGHNSVNFAVAGERVRTGTILAEVGSTGRSQGPHVHFELIHAGENCDPLHLWRPGVRHRDGTTHPRPLVWREPRRRPQAISCAPRRGHHSIENETLPAAAGGEPTSAP